MIWPKKPKRLKLDLWLQWIQENPALAYMKEKFELDLIKDEKRK